MWLLLGVSDGGGALRVNMDSSVASDPRFKLVATDIGKPWREVIGSCFLLWLACYERRSDRLPIDEADLASQVDGFSRALAARGLADIIDEKTVRIHGVKERIKFLKRQRTRGSSGGKKSGESRRSKKKAREANASPESSERLEKNEAYSHTHTPAHTPAPALVASSAALAALPQGGVATTRDVEQLASANGWAVQLGPPEIKAARRALARGPVPPDIVGAAVRRTEETKPDKPLLYFLGTVAGMVDDLHRGRAPPRASRAVNKQDQSFEASFRAVEAFNASRK